MLARSYKLYARCGGHAVRSMSQINALYQPGSPMRHLKAPNPAELPPMLSKVDQDKQAVLAEHAREWTEAELEAAGKKHSMFTWGASGPMGDNAIHAVRAEGVYFWDRAGKKYLDFNSQAMCLHHGFTPDPMIVDEVTEQLKTMPYMYPGLSMVPVRSKLCSLLSDIVPGDINTFMFPGSGAEANEAGMRFAKKFTGREKILAQYRSYHGGTNATMMATGDFRRWGAEPGMPGVKHFFGPAPYSFQWGETEADVSERALLQLREVISYEGPNNIASIMLESIVGTNGLLIPPAGYLEGVRQICDETGILMHCDEVMAGFGRTGSMFGFQAASPSVVPDIVTFAKGVNGAFIPMGGIGITDKMAEFFRTNPNCYGSTYNGHPVALASAYAALKVLLRDGLVENSKAMEPHMRAGFEALAANHRCIKQVRGIGLFWAMDIQRNTAGDFLSEVAEPPTAALGKFKGALLEGGMFTMMRGHSVFANPPLIITKEQIEEGFAIFDKALVHLDEAMED